MSFSSRAVELTTLLESRISSFSTHLKVDEIGQVVSVGYEIARVSGLKEIQACGQMAEFACSVKGVALNPENENVWVVVFGSDTSIKEGDIFKRTGSIVDVPAGKAFLGHMVDALGLPIDGRGSLFERGTIPFALSMSSMSRMSRWFIFVTTMAIAAYFSSLSISCDM